VEGYPKRELREATNRVLIRLPSFISYTFLSDSFHFSASVSRYHLLLHIIHEHRRMRYTEQDSLAESDSEGMYLLQQQSDSTDKPHKNRSIHRCGANNSDLLAFIEFQP
jgi:hypothetical protein